MSAVTPASEASPQQVICEPLLQPSAAQGRDAVVSVSPSRAPANGTVTIGSLLPISACPQLAFDPRIQSVDLFATSPHILEGSNRCAWCPCGSRGPVFNWIALLHAAANSFSAPSNPATTPTPGSQNNNNSNNNTNNNSNNNLPPAGSRQQQAVQLLQGFREGAVPIGCRADLATLVGHNQLVFGGVKEVNAAYSNAWLCIYAGMALAFFLAPLGWVLLCLISFSATVRRALDVYTLHWMSETCMRVNALLHPCGVALMLLEGSSEAAAVSASAALLLADVELATSNRMQQGRKVWILRVFMLPQRQQQPTQQAPPAPAREANNYQPPEE